MKEETKYWVGLAEEDLRVASLALEGAFHRPCVFHCQQALEKLLKAMWIEQAAEGYPPREHNLNSLAQEIGLKLTKEQMDFLDDLSKQYNPSRYGDVAVEYSREQAENYYERTEETFAWLQRQLS